MKNFIAYCTHFLLLITVFAFPLFFLPFTQEYFITNKLYLLTAAALILISLSIVKFIFTRKFNWHKTPFDTSLFLFIMTIALSIIISSPNKIQALLNQNFGLVLFMSLTILYFYLTHLPQIHVKKENKTLAFLTQITPFEAVSFSSLILSVITIVFFFNPFKNISIPSSLQFLKTPQFTPLGSQLDLAFFLGFFLIIYVAQATTQKFSDKSLKSTFTKFFSVGSTLLTLVALTLTVFSILKSTANIILPPFNLSWYSAVEILKNPLSALFGVGVDNFASIFTKVKDAGYSLSNFWQVNSFAVSRSTILHVFSEIGIFGFIAFSLIILGLIRAVKKIEIKETRNILLICAGYLLLLIAFFPPSIYIFFLLFLTLSLLGQKGIYTDKSINTKNLETTKNNLVIDVYYVLPLYIGIFVISFILVGASVYFLSRSYVAEFYFKKSLDGILTNNVKKLYDNQRQAIVFNPYIERFRINFAQTNFWIANNLASKKKEELTNQDKQTINDAIQTAISEAKASVTLNSQKGSNWANLAEIYRNILYAAQGADAWTISAYQRAILADPQNPAYRFNLGGVYFSLNNLEDASRLFEQAIAIKPDWPTPHYNLAWVYYKKNDFQQAVSEMQNTLNLIDPKKSKADYEKAKSELEEFKKKLPTTNDTNKQTEAESSSKEPSQLNIATPQVATFSPKLELPETASPEAR